MVQKFPAPVNVPAPVRDIGLHHLPGAARGEWRFV
jgi:hypothetical protein